MNATIQPVRRWYSKRLNRYLRGTFEVIMTKRSLQRHESRWPRSALKLHNLLNSKCLPALGSMEKTKSILGWISVGSLQRCASEVTEQFPYKAHKGFLLQAAGAMSPGEVCSHWGQPQVEASARCSSVIDLIADYLLVAGSADSELWISPGRES